MSKHSRMVLAQLTAWARVASRRSQAALWHAWDIHRSRDVRIPIEVLVADPRRRRKIRSELRAGVRRLQRVLGEPPADHIAVVVQQVIATDRQLAGCCQLGSHPDGSSHALWRLALEVNGRPLSSDELLAVLAEQWFALAGQLSSPRVLIPVDLERGETFAAKHASTLPRDPLAPYSDSVNSHRA